MLFHTQQVLWRFDEKVGKFEELCDNDELPPPILESRGTTLTACAFSPDGRVLVLTGVGWDNAEFQDEASYHSGCTTSDSAGSLRVYTTDNWDPEPVRWTSQGEEREKF